MLIELNKEYSIVNNKQDKVKIIATLSSDGFIGIVNERLLKYDSKGKCITSEYFNIELEELEDAKKFNYKVGKYYLRKDKERILILFISSTNIIGINSSEYIEEYELDGRMINDVSKNLLTWEEGKNYYMRNEEEITLIYNGNKGKYPLVGVNAIGEVYKWDINGGTNINYIQYDLKK